MAYPVTPGVFSRDRLRRSARSGIATCVSLLILLEFPTPAYALPAQQLINTGVATAQKSDDVRALEPGKPIERELSGSEVHFYQITLVAGQFLRVVIDQRGINLIVILYGPDTRKIAEIDSPIGSQGAEPASLVAEASGSYRLEVRAWQKSAPKGRYEVRVEELRAATLQDKTRVAAERAFAEATLVSGQGTAESLRKAIEKYREIVPLWQALGDRQQEAYTLTVIGYTHGGLAEYQKALDYYNQALPLSRAAGDRRGEAMTLYNTGLVYNVLGEHRKALDFYNLALQIHRDAGNRSMEAATLGNIGAVYSNLGEQQKALEFFNQALPLKRIVGDPSGEATLLNNIGFIYSSLGEPRKALEFFNQTLPIYQAIGDRPGEATTLNNIASVYDDSGEYQKALDLLNQVVQIKRAAGNSAEEAIALNNISVVYNKLGEYQKALDSLNQALPKQQAAGVRPGEAVTLGNIGQVHGRLGDYQKALDFNNQALSILREVGDSRGQAIALNNIAHAYSDSGDKKKALEFYDQSLTLRRASNDRRGEAVTLNNIGSIYQDLGETRKALDCSNQALATFRDIGDRPGQAVALNYLSSIYKKLGDSQKALDYSNQALVLLRYTGNRNEEARALHNIAVVERDRGNLVEASNYIDKTLATVESLRTQVVSQRLRASFLASVQKYYEFDIDVLMRLHKQRPSEGFDARALQASEKARARSLLELITEARAGIRQGADPALLERERSLRQSISARAERQTRMLGGKHSAEQAAAAAREIDKLTTEYEQVQARIRQTSPHYAALTQPLPLSLKEIQTEVLDDETLLLEYALGEEKSFLWAVTPTSIKSFELPKRTEIETAARRIYEILTARNQFTSKETPEQRRLRLEAADVEYPKASAALSQMLLGPVASQLGSRRLVIVSEGLLQYLPFAALPKPAAGAGGWGLGAGRIAPQPPVPSPRPLIVDHEVVSLPSASVLGVLRRETAGRGAAPRTVAILADPVFDRGDPRVGGLSKGRTTGAEEVSLVDVQRSAAESGLPGFVRLRFSRQEADEIARLAPEGEKLKALDFAASRVAATSAELGQYRIVHFATHGLVNSQHPELSGIVLSLVDEQGRPQNGFLRLYDIYNLKLGADLVVLSACQTALGKEVKGEGLVGLTRGFMYAGAPRVAASLWRIDDRASAELMKRFYLRMLGEGMSAASALRAAQVSMWREKRWAAPHYWAAFTLQGEWK